MFYEFTLPVSGKAVTWKPLTVGRSLDVSAAHRSESMRHLLGPSMLMARIIGFDGREASPTMAEMRDMDEFDLEALSEEVDQKEAARKAAFRKDRQGGDPGAMVNKAIEDAQIATLNLGLALKALLEARQVEDQNSGPLGSRKT